MASANVQIQDVVEKFQNVLQKNGLGFGVSKMSDNKARPIFGNPGVATRYFVTELMRDRDNFFAFLKESGLIKTPNCPICNVLMQVRTRNDVSDGYSFVCQNSIIRGESRKMSGKQVSLRYGSWFNSSRLTIEEIFLLTFEIVIGTRTGEIKEQYFFGDSTLSDWRQFINERILEYVEENSEKIGGVGKIVEVDESKFGKRKYNRGHRVEGQWVFGGVERGSGRRTCRSCHCKGCNNPRICATRNFKVLNCGSTDRLLITTTTPNGVPPPPEFIYIEYLKLFSNHKDLQHPPFVARTVEVTETEDVGEATDVQIWET
ncbi:hypothetical protein HNY73_005540 [Argiope bruennichi]|uniref:Transposase n=1 Tax=Argiope bruennichi TaxID=94029 RepID=A0A8T0FHQ6_ARGBR|nr:hypothetical protein HNY73_005540 [Argiope bruennichi]